MGPQTPSHLQQQITHMELVSCLTVARLRMLAGTYVLSIGSYENLLPLYVTTGQRFGLWSYNQATNPVLDRHCMTAVCLMHPALRHSQIFHTKKSRGECAGMRDDKIWRTIALFNFYSRLDPHLQTSSSKERCWLWHCFITVGLVLTLSDNWCSLPMLTRGVTQLPSS